MGDGWLDRILTQAPVFIGAIALHEAAHAWAAVACGDDTPRDDGRLTIDPRAHLDPFGTIFGLLFGIGWGRPVRVDPSRMRSPSRDMALVAAAGPASNLLQALLFAAVWAGLRKVAPVAPGELAHYGMSVVVTGVYLNLALMFFNLIPLFPLDGYAVARGLMHGRVAWEVEDRYRTFNMQYGSAILMLLFVLPSFPGLPSALDPVTYLVREPRDWLARRLLGF